MKEASPDPAAARMATTSALLVGVVWVGVVGVGVGVGIGGFLSAATFNSVFPVDASAIGLFRLGGEVLFTEDQHL